MKNRAILVASAALLALSACDKGDKTPSAPAAGGSQSVEDVAAEMKKVALQPGEWETTSEVVDVKMEGAPKGMPPGALDAMKGRKTTFKNCITPEQAANPSADFLTAQKESKCTYSGFQMTGGTVQGAISCPGGQGRGMTATMKGIYTPTSYDIGMDMTTGGGGAGDASAPAMSMQMKMRTTGKRIGECTAASKK